MADFKTGTFMYILALGVIAFVIAQSMFFIIKAWKHGKQIGISTKVMKDTVISSVFFTIAPAISILVTVFALAGALGVVLPWIRLSVIGNLLYETSAAQATLENFGSSLSSEITDPSQFTAVAWVMTVGSVFPLILLPFICKKLQKKIGSAVGKSEGNKKLADLISAAALIGIISAFAARSLAGTTAASAIDVAGNTSAETDANAGLMSVTVLIVAIAVKLLLDFICNKFKLKTLDLFSMPIALFTALAVSVLLTMVLPAEIAEYVWR